MTTAISHAGDPYPTARAIDRALEGRGWRVVVMHAENGGVIRIAPHGLSLFDPDALVLKAGQQLVIDGDGDLTIDPDSPGAAGERRHRN